MGGVAKSKIAGSMLLKKRKCRWLEAYAPAIDTRDPTNEDTYSDAASAGEMADQRNQEQNDENEEQHFCDACSRDSNAAKA